MILGGHVSAAGGVLKAIERAQALDFAALQLFPSSPQGWGKPNVTDEDAATFKAAMAPAGIQKAFFHNIYLTNFAAEANGHWHGTIGITRAYLKLAHKMGVSGVITHTGSHKGAGMAAVLDRVVEGLHKTLADLPDDAPFLIENTAGAGGTIGRTLEEIELIVAKLKPDHKNLGVCIDTCHAFASGIPIHTEEGLEAFLNEFDERMGLEMLRCIHLNDSKNDFDTNKDRHENLGQGFFGEANFARILKHPKLQNIPFIMEVPGIEDKGPDAWNRDKARELAK